MKTTDCRAAWTTSWAVAGCLLAVVSNRAAAQQMNYPLAVAVDKQGTIYVADRNLPGIWKVADGKAEKYFQGSRKFGTPLNAVRCLAIDNKGKLLAGDSATREVYRFDDSAKPVPLTKGDIGIGIPVGIAVRSSGEILVSDQELQCIWKVPAEGGQAVKWVSLPAPVGIALDAQDRLWVVSRSQRQLRRITTDGKVEIVLAKRPFAFPHQIVWGPKDAVYVTDGYGKAVWKYMPGKDPEKLAEGAPLQNPVGIARRGDDLLLADPRARAIFQVDATGKVTNVAR